jgi:adenylate cyclase
MNEFLTPLTRVIYKHLGTIDKYMGIASWHSGGSARRSTARAQRRARRSGDAQVLDALQPHFQKWAGPNPNWRGREQRPHERWQHGLEIRLAYTVMGDA